jgi:hypothetical protein
LEEIRGLLGHKKVSELAKRIDEVNPKGDTTTTDIFEVLYKSMVSLYRNIAKTKWKRGLKRAKRKEYKIRENSSKDKFFENLIRTITLYYFMPNFKKK